MKLNERLKKENTKHKKNISFVIAAVMLLPILGTCVFASETQDAEREQILDAACKVFPEYENIIRNQNTDAASNARTTENSKLVIQETRPVSDSEYITYLGYSDNTAMIISSTGSFSFTTSNSNVEEGTGVTNNTITLTVVSTASSGKLTLSNIKFSYYHTTYDKITSTGTVTTNSYCKYDTAVYPTCKLSENASGNAYIRINQVQFLISGASNWGQCKVLDFEFTVGKNRMDVNLTAYED